MNYFKLIRCGIYGNRTGTVSGAGHRRAPYVRAGYDDSWQVRRLARIIGSHHRGSLALAHPMVRIPQGLYYLSKLITNVQILSPHKIMCPWRKGLVNK